MTAFIREIKRMEEQIERCQTEISNLKKIQLTIIKAYEVPIGELGLSIRAYRCLLSENLATVGDVLDMYYQNPDFLLAIRGFGEGSLLELETLLKSKGYLSD